VHKYALLSTAAEIKVMFCRKMRLILLIVIIIQGCAMFGIQSPSMEVIDGKWESTSLLGYSYLSVNANGDSYLVIVNDQADDLAFKLHSFKFTDNYFSVKLTNLAEKEKDEVFKGMIIQNKLLLIQENEDDESVMSFIREGQIDALRLRAKASLGAIIENEHNEEN